MRVIVAGDLIITGPGPDILTVDAGGGSRLFTVSSGNVEIAGLKLTGGRMVTRGGGAIHNQGKLTMRRSGLTGNTASLSSGGAVHNTGSLTIVNCTFADNASGGESGIFIAEGHEIVLNITIERRGNKIAIQR